MLSIFTTLFSVVFSRSVIYIKFIFPILVLVTLIIIFLDYKNIYHSVLNFDSMFIFVFWVFTMSRQLTYLFGYQSYSSPYTYKGIEEYCRAYLFSYLCLIFYYFGSWFRPIRFNKELVIYNTNLMIRLRKALLTIIFILSIPTVWYYYRLISTALVASYGSREFDSLITNTGYLVSLFHNWAVISIVALLALQIMISKKNYLFLLIIYLSMTVLSLFAGSRSEGISLLIVFAYVFSEKTKKRYLYLILPIAFLFISSLIPLFYELRKDLSAISSIRISSFVGISSLLSAIHEMGGSEAPLLLVMSNNYVEFGKSYLLAFLNTLFNFLPLSFRPDFTSIGPHSLASYYSRLLGLEYGLGFSLVAEAFLNFRWFGFFVFFIFRFGLSNLIGKSNYIDTYLIKIILIFLLLTMPRRESKDLFLSIFYYWIPFVLLFRTIRKNAIRKGV